METWLKALLSWRWDKKLQQNSNGRIFLVINPVGFCAVVAYLNKIEISSEDDPPTLPSTDEEHQHILRHQLELFEIFDKEVELPNSIIVNSLRAKSVLVHFFFPFFSLDERPF